MKDKLIRFINETIDKTTKARAASNKIMADDCAGNLAYNLAYTYSNYADEDDALSIMIKKDLDHDIQQYFDLGDATSKCDYKEMWEELIRRIECKMQDHFGSQIYMAGRKDYANTYSHMLRREELDNVLTIMRHLEEERFNKWTLYFA